MERIMGEVVKRPQSPRLTRRSGWLILWRRNIWHYSSFVGGTADGWGMGVYCGWDYYFNTGYLAFENEAKTFDPLVDTDIEDECWYQTEPLSFADPSTEGYPNYESYISVYNYEPFPEIIPTSVMEIGSSTVDLYPNPASEQLFISTTDQFLLDVYNLNGSKVFSCNSCSQIDIESWPQGVYLIDIVAGQDISSYKIIVQ
ncbi:MAG: T9SS type A sorting domain-containing protein [Chitinophagales bacterium]|nr:T9SS type A sorting domain-containing protein [Chitinophagales bacterium]